MSVLFPGEPIPGWPFNPDNSVSLPQSVFPEPRIYAYQVTGDSMTGDGISDTDIVVVDPDGEVIDGDIAVVWYTTLVESGKRVEGPVLKHLRTGETGWVLESSNPRYAPLALRPEHQAEVRGLAIGIVTMLGDGTLVAQRIQPPLTTAVQLQGQGPWIEAEAQAIIGQQQNRLGETEGDMPQTENVDRNG